MPWERPGASAGGGGGGGVTWANDLAGSSNTHQYVAAISGSGGAGGVVPLNITTLQFAAGQVTPALDQAAPASDLATTSLTIQSQPAYASAVTNLNAGTLSLDTGAPHGAGSARVQVGATNATVLALGNSTTTTSITETVTSSGTMTGTVGATSVFSQGNASGDFIYIGPQATSASMQLVPTGITFQKAVVSPAFQQSAPTTDTATTTLSITSQPAYASAVTNLNAGTLSLDTGAPHGAGSAQISLGPTNATTVRVGNTTTTGNITENITNTGNWQLVTASTTLAFIGQAATDHVRLGVSPATAGYLQVPTASPETIVGAGTGNLTMLGFDGNGAGILSGYVSNQGVGFNDNGTRTATLLLSATGGNNAQLLFSSTNATLASFIGWDALNPIGAGALLAIVGQHAKSGSNGNGGGVQLVSGQLDGTGTDGGISFGFNAAIGGSVIDSVQFIGANTSAARGTFKWSSAITPKLTQAIPAANANPLNFTLAPQAPANLSGATIANNTPGSFVVALQLPGSTTSQGLNATFQVQDNGANQAWIGNYGSVSGGTTSLSALWLGSGNAGITPSAGNYALIFNGASVFVNAGGGGAVGFNISGTTYSLLQTGGWGGDASSRNYRLNSPANISVGNGGTTSPSAAALATGSFLVLTSLGTTTSQVVLDFSNSSQQQGSFWVVDTAGVTFGASLGISVKYGTSTVVVSGSGQPTGSMFFVAIDATSNRILWH